MSLARANAEGYEDRVALTSVSCPRSAITAFPVLARILTDQNLLRDPLGVVVLSAGVGNDVV